MTNVRLGSTGITVNKNGFGALPIQRISKDEAVRLLHKAFDGGMRFYDTARLYTDSEEKLGAAFSDRREQLCISSKTGAVTADAFWKDLETTLHHLKTDHLDIYQFHNPAFCPKPGDESGIYDAALEAKKKGMILHIGITNHRLNVAQEAIESGLYETLQFPFCYLSGEPELKLLEGCRKQNMGFLSMKALSGGLITNAAAAYAFQAQVLPEDEVAFKYYQFIDVNSEAEFNSNIAAMAEMSLYNTGITPVYGDELVTLSTCDRSQGAEGRFVVVGVKIA